MIERIELMDQARYSFVGPVQSIACQNVTGTLSFGFGNDNDNGVIKEVNVLGRLHLAAPTIHPTPQNFLELIFKMNQVITLLNEILEKDRALHALSNQD